MNYETNIPLRKKFGNETYTQTGNGAGKESERREIMSKKGASELADDYIRRGWKGIIVPLGGGKYAVYTRS